MTDFDHAAALIESLEMLAAELANLQNLRSRVLRAEQKACAMECGQDGIVGSENRYSPSSGGDGRIDSSHQGNRFTEPGRSGMGGERITCDLFTLDAANKSTKQK